MMDRLLHGTKMNANGLTHYVVDEGAGKPVVFLHGFPDTADLWRHQMPALTSGGFRVIAPDLRGYGETDRPEKDEDYVIFNVVADVLAIMDGLDIDRFQVVGHDEGAGVGWMLATLNADRVERFVSLTVGHPGSLVLQGMEQMRLSWYSFFFQFKGLAEEKLMDNDWSLMREWLSSSPDMERSIEALARPGALSAALGLYRANMRPEIWGVPLPYPPVTIPVMGIHAAEDFALTEEQMTGSKDYVAGEWRYERIDGAGHWLQLEKPDVVNALLLDFLEP